VKHVHVAEYYELLQYRRYSHHLTVFFTATKYRVNLQGGPKTDAQFYYWDNFGTSAPILTILSLLQAEIYGA